MKGVVNLYKPRGWTSRDAVNKVRNLLGVKDVGHMGTLDPQGEGVLLIGVGKGTRLFDAFLKKDKVYEADFAFGYETDTLDGEGKIIGCTENIPGRAEIEKALEGFKGKMMQLPPSYSAKSVGGVRAYKLAREGKEFTLSPAPVEIYSVRITDNPTENLYRFTIHCSAGTYIRSLCRDIAYSVSSLATMTYIKRIRAGKFDVKDSYTVEELMSLKEKAVIPLEEALSDFPEFIVDDSDYFKLLNGVKLPVGEVPKTPFTVYCKNELFGLGEKSDDGILKIKTYLRD